MGTAPYTAGETIDADDAGVVALGQRASDNTFQIVPIEPTPSLNSIALGQVTGWGVVDKFGKNEDVGTAYEDIWAGGGTQTLLTTSSTMIVTSTGVDTVAGTGALTVKLMGLDNTYANVEETVILDAASPPTTTASFIRVFRAFVVTAGTGLTNANQIDITATTGGSVQAVILADEGQTQQAIYTIPLNKQGFLSTITLSTDVASNRVVTAQLLIRPFGGAWQVKHETIIATGAVPPFDMTGSGAISAKSDVKWRAKANQGTTNEVIGGFKILLEDTA